MYDLLLPPIVNFARKKMVLEKILNTCGPSL